MTGIDKLIRSQELTFAFVGVSPAIAIVWGVTSWAIRAWTGSNGRGRFGGVKARTRAFLAIRCATLLLNSSLQRIHYLFLAASNDYCSTPATPSCLLEHMDYCSSRCTSCARLAMRACRVEAVCARASCRMLKISRTRTRGCGGRISWRWCSACGARGHLCLDGMRL